MGINKESLYGALRAKGDDILNNSEKKPIVGYFPSLVPLSHWTNESARIVVCDTPYLVRSTSYKAGFNIPLTYNFRSLGIWTDERDPVGFCEYRISNEGVPWGHINGIQIGQKGENDCTFGMVEGRPDEFGKLWQQLQIPEEHGLGSNAYYLRPKYRGNGLGQTMHAIMMSLLQASGYPQLMTMQDITVEEEWRKDHNHRSFRLREDKGTLTRDPSLYGRYTDLLEQRSSNGATYSTALSTYQVFLLCQATESSLSM